MISTYYPPSFNEESFHCAICNVFSKQKWYHPNFYKRGVTVFTDVHVSQCEHCDRLSYWYNEQLIIPNSSIAPMPHSDLPESLSADYLEARSIASLSPRGAAALLRLCLQKLMAELGESGRDINKDIGSLVKKGLPEEVQQSLDIVGVIGNEAVHPGELDLRDDPSTVLQLFELINFIVEDCISRKKK